MIMKKLLGILVLGLLLSGNAYSAKNFDGFLKAIGDAKKMKITIDFENTAREYGFKNAEEFFNEFKKKFDIEDVTFEEAKKYLIGADRSVKIEETEENLKILHRLILKDKYVKKFLRKKKKHAKILAVYLDYEKAMSEITKNPKLKKIDRLVSYWAWHINKGPETAWSQESDALIGCENERKKRGVPEGGTCILVEYRYGNEFKILLKPILKNNIASKNTNLNLEKILKDQQAILDEKKKIAETKKKQEIEKNKIAEEKRKIEEEKKKIAELQKEEEKKKKSKKEEPKFVPASSGTGFFVTGEGHIVTNYHVVQNCDTTFVSFDGQQIATKVLAVDKMNDLAILKVNLTPAKVFSVATEDASLLEDIIIAGYPLGKKVSAAIKTSKGSITALAGYGDNY